jgi:hypothetical protein
MIIFSCLFFTLIACYTPNNFITRSSAFAKTIRKANNDKRHFVMFSGVDTFAIIHIMVENARREMTVQLNTIDSIQRMNLVYPKTLKGKQIVLYMRDSTSYTLEEPHTLPINQIARIQLIN